MCEIPKWVVNRPASHEAIQSFIDTRQARLDKMVELVLDKLNANTIEDATGYHYDMQRDVVFWLDEWGRLLGVRILRRGKPYPDGSYGVKVNDYFVFPLLPYDSRFFERS